MAEPQDLAAASAGLFISGAVVAAASFLLPAVSVAGLSLVLILGLVIMIVGGLLFIMQVNPMDVEFTYDVLSFRVRGPFFGKTLEYSDIVSIEYEEFNPGKSTLFSMNAKEGIIGGQFKNPSAGKYHVTGYVGEGDIKFILMKTSEGMQIAFNLESKEETDRAYEVISSRVSATVKTGR